MPKKDEKEQKVRKSTPKRKRTKQKAGALDTAAFVIPETPEEDTRNRIAALDLPGMSDAKDVYPKVVEVEQLEPQARADARVAEMKDAVSRIGDLGDNLADKLPINVTNEDSGQTIVSISANHTLASKLLNNEQLFQAERDILYEYVDRLQDEAVKRKYYRFLQKQTNRSGFRVFRRNIRKEVREEKTADIKGAPGPDGPQWDHGVYKWRRILEIARLKHEARKFDLVLAQDGGWAFSEVHDEWKWKGEKKISVELPQYPRLDEIQQLEDIPVIVSAEPTQVDIKQLSQAKSQDKPCCGPQILGGFPGSSWGGGGGGGGEEDGEGEGRRQPMAAKQTR